MKNKTRKVSKTKKVKTSVLTIPELRKAFDHMDTVVESLRKMKKHSFSDAVLLYREEWRKTFKRDISPADASAYLKFRFGTKSSKTRRTKTRGGSPLAGAPLDYSLRPGSSGVYGNFPSYQTEGLDRYYGSAISADCGKSAQQGGMNLAGIRGFESTAPPTTMYKVEMGHMGTPPYPSADPVGTAPFRTMPASYITTANVATHLRSHGADVFK